MPPVAGVLLINPRGGTERPSAEELAEAARARGIEAHVLDEGEDLAELARSADADVLGAAGGDGSVASVASVAVERDLPFVVVPYGTRNHFARDLGLDVDPLAALAAFEGEERRVDVGRAGERRFLNNVSLGALRDARPPARASPPPAPAARRTACARAQHPQPPGVWAKVDGEPVRARVLLVANNAYELSLFSIGERERLDEGRLYLYAAKGVLPRTWDERSGEHFELDVPGGKVSAAIDGEPVELETPLELAVEPRALRVLLPRREH